LVTARSERVWNMFISASEGDREALMCHHYAVAHRRLFGDGIDCLVSRLMDKGCHK
jgi:hypothetical protein